MNFRTEYNESPHLWALAQRSYTPSELQQLLQDKEARIEDYILKIYYMNMQINDIPLEHQIRLNNLIFNNFDKIKPLIEEQILLPRILEKTLEFVEQQKYLALIINFDLKLPTKPIAVQYYDPYNGIQRYIIHCMDRDYDYFNKLKTSTLYPKLTSYCGANYYLNYHSKFDSAICDNFIDHLFDIIFDYFPLNPIDCLRHLGLYIQYLPLTEPIIEDLKISYHRWQTKQTLIDAEYFEMVLTNFQKIETYLDQYDTLPKSVVLFFADPSSPFYLCFLLEIYYKFENCYYLEGVSLYSRLDRLYSDFAIFKETLLVTDRTECLLKELDNQRLLESISSTYERIYIIVANLRKKLLKLYVFEWVLLLDHQLDYEEVHESYHYIHDLDECDSDRCTELLGNYRNIERVLLEYYANLRQSGLMITEIWCEIFKLCHQKCLIVDKLRDLVCYIFSIPGSNYRHVYRQLSDSKFKMVCQFNYRISWQILNDMHGFLNDDLLIMGQKIIDENRVTNVED